MKLSKTSWLALIIGVYVVVFAGLGIFHIQQMYRQKQLREEVTGTEQKAGEYQLEQLTSQKEDLENRIVQVAAQYEAVKSIFARPVSSVTAGNILFDLADSFNLEVTEVSSLKPTTENLGGIECAVISFTARVEGSISDIINFVNKLSGQMATDVVRSIRITYPETPDEETSADIHLIIYTYQGE
jgi:hypothetical protein